MVHIVPKVILKRRFLIPDIPCKTEKQSASIRKISAAIKE